jgi:hypothetical protein
MSTQTLLDPPEAPAWQPLLVLISSIAALVLIVVVGLSLWEPPERAGEAPAAAGSAAAVGEGTAPLIGGMAEVYRAQAASGATAPPIYLVASQAQADAVQRELAEADIRGIGAALGTAPRTASVVLFPSAEAEVYFWSVVGEQERAGTFMDPITVVDRRHAAGAPPIETVYLVSTPEQATTLQARITADADQQGAPPPNARVVVAGTDEATIALRASNEIVPPGRVRLIDRRMP